MLKCNDPRYGYLKYNCETCGKTKYIKFSCNSRICSRCGKRYTDKWSQGLAQKLFPITHRHFIFTIPSELWSLLEKDTKLWKILLDTVKITFDKVVNWKRAGRKLNLGIICVLHTYGSDLKFNPHVHTIITEGGLTKKGRWIRQFYFNYNSMRKIWQYHILIAIRNRYKGNIMVSELVNKMFQKYRNGFVIDGKRRISNMKNLAKYVARYIRHPAIADSRLQNYDGKEVQFMYKTRIDGKILYHKKIMQVNDFIEVLLNFIPPKNLNLLGTIDYIQEEVK